MLQVALGGGIMIHRCIFVVLAVAALIPGLAQEPTCKQRASRRGECAGYGSRDATVLSMMGWGLGLGAGIAALCALIPNNSATSHSH